MLYEFHRKQNAKKAGTVHATYLITGTRRVEAAPSQTNGVHSRDGEDTVMQSSPVLPSSSMPRPEEAAEEPSFIRSIMLVKEEHLDQAKRALDTVASIHVYSLEANSLSDIQALTECNRKVATSYSSEDPLQAWKQYGTIQNPNARRRTRRGPPPPPAPVAKDADVKTKPLVPTTTSKKESDTTADSKPPSAKQTPEPDKKGSTKPAQTKRQSSDIFKSFAKGKTKAKQESQSSAEATPAPEPEDEPMGGFSEDDAGDDATAAQEDETKVQAGPSKKDRAAELQAMMDQEDEPMEDAPTPAEESQDAETAIDKPDSQKDEESKETVTVENGRRRGRRRVMKKKTVKDEEGYLVTREEPAWESFSEDEPAPKKIKVPPASSTNAGSKASVGKKGGKPGQGNIMSFFGKK
ncbi:hypothetical protein LTR37_010840 [Vermiconidia calcicola]|uniref:Uncharacterized protein n=1 Tax=Vermiconidia calcicola TaxID=1690605 RepID=A0ACC3N5B7_9PEZI|nr:hypothetical protein LTR37_010840 [Vermiconidia calcicola]